jgi:hypothetical protein
MWRTYRTLRSASCVDGLAVRAAVWRWRGGAADMPCVACGRAAGGRAGGALKIDSQNRTNSRLNVISRIIAEPSRRVWHSDGDAVTLTGPAGRSRGRRDRRTRPRSGRRQTQRALRTRHGPGAACAPRRRSAQLPQWRNWRIAPSMRAGADEYEFAIRNCRVTFAYVDATSARPARGGRSTGVWPSCGELFVETVPGFLYRYRVPS